MDLEIFGSVIWLLLLIVFMIIFIALPLWITTRLMDEDEGILRAFGTTVLLVITFMVCLIFIPINILDLLVAIVVNLFIIKAVYDTDWGKAFIMWVITIIVTVQNVGKR